MVPYLQKQQPSFIDKVKNYDTLPFYERLFLSMKCPVLIEKYKQQQHEGTKLELMQIQEQAREEDLKKHNLEKALQKLQTSPKSSNRVFRPMLNDFTKCSPSYAGPLGVEFKSKSQKERYYKIQQNFHTLREKILERQDQSHEIVQAFVYLHIKERANEDEINKLIDYLFNETTDLDPSFSQKQAVLFALNRRPLQMIKS